MCVVLNRLSVHFTHCRCQLQSYSLIYNHHNVKLIRRYNIISLKMYFAAIQLQVNLPIVVDSIRIINDYYDYDCHYYHIKMIDTKSTSKFILYFILFILFYN